MFAFVSCVWSYFYVLCFFFKQKTAYEMRISDWSSDVCSSDLMKPGSVVLFRAWFRYLRQAGLSYGLTTVVDALRRAPKVATALVARFEAAHEIGRASCRDSVCQDG